MKKWYISNNFANQLCYKYSNNEDEVEKILEGGNKKIKEKYTGSFHVVTYHLQSDDENVYDGETIRIMLT